MWRELEAWVLGIPAADVVVYNPRLVRPRLIPTLALASAICCLLLCGLWVRSYGRSDQLSLARPDRLWAAVGYAGHIEVGWIAGFQGPPVTLDYMSGPAMWSDGVEVSRRMPGGWGWSMAGFSVGGWVPTGRTVRQVTFPYWFPVLLTLIPPALWWRRRRRRSARGFPVEAAQDA